MKRYVMSEYIEEAISEAELMLCPKGLSHTGMDNRAEHGHHTCWVIGELLNEIERLRSALDAEGNEANLLMLEIGRLRAELKDADDNFHALKAMFDKMRADVKRWRTIATNLIHGAEQQIDEFREPWDKSTNEAWLGAWHDYHQAVLDEGAK